MTVAVIIILVIISGYALSKWWQWFMSSAILMLFIIEKGYKMPSDEEMRACAKQLLDGAIKNWLKS